jgi:hypothetical protein
MARLDNMMADGGGVPTSYVPADSAATNAVANAAVTPPVKAVDTRIALRKLQSGEPLTDDEKRSLGLPVTEIPVVKDEGKPKWVKAS